jgi:hypothetical protein
VRRLFPILVVAGLLCVAAPATAKTETRTSGDVTASVTYSGKNPPFRSARLTITQAGLTVFDGAVKMPCKACGLQSVFNRRVMKLRDLDGDSEPEVLLDVFSGGAHCCAYSLVYRFVPFGNTYERIAWPWGNVGYQLRDLNRDGTLEFVSGDDRFAYLFTSYADSVFPITIYRLGEKGFADVTRKFRATVRAQARRFLRFYRRALRDKRDVRGILAAYQADQYLARRSKQGWRVLRRAARRGQLKSPYGDNTGPSGKRYLRALLRYLRRWGYAPKSSSSARAAR